MDTAVIVALISLAGSALTAVVAGVLAHWQTSKANVLRKEFDASQKAANVEFELLRQRLQLESREEERRHEARARLRTYREPLLEAVRDLGSRIGNIRTGGFLIYVHAETPRRDVAVQSTLYRLARYFGTLERVYEGITYLHFEDAGDTRDVGRLIKAIEQTFSSDRFDPDESQGAMTSRFMIWREEQRAMGESVLVRTESGENHIVGFGEFVTRSGADSWPWFANFTRDLMEGDAARSRRLARLQGQLAQLARALDTEGRVGDRSSNGTVVTAEVTPASRERFRFDGPEVDGAMQLRPVWRVT